MLMRIDPLEQYARLRKQLTDEKAQLQTRLAEINAVLSPEDVSVPSSSLDTVATESFTLVPAATRRGRKPRGTNAVSMREAVLKALANGPLARKELVKAVEAVGYVFTSKNPLNSVGSVLYSKNSPIKNRGGKYYLPGRAATEASPNNEEVQAPAKKKKRRMSAAGRARIAAAARAMWAKRKAGK